MVRKTQKGAKAVVSADRPLAGKYRRRTQLPKYLRDADVVTYFSTKKRVIKKAVKLPGPDFSPEETKISGHYYLSSNADKIRFCADYSAMHHYPKNKPLKYRTTNIPGLAAMEKKFKIAPVAALGNPETSEKSFGIFATRSIWVPPHTKMPIGRYLGKKIEAGKESKQSSFVMEVLDPEVVIDADSERNWIPMINGALSEQAANISIINLGDNAQQSPHF